MDLSGQTTVHAMEVLLVQGIASPDLFEYLVYRMRAVSVYGVVSSR